MLRTLAHDPHVAHTGSGAIERIEAMRESGAKCPGLSDIDDDDEADDDDDSGADDKD